MSVKTSKQGAATGNFPGLENARDLVASSSQAVLDSVDSLNDLWGQVKGRNARLADVIYSAASAWESYYTLAMDFLRLPLGIRDGGRPGWAIFKIGVDEGSPSPIEVPLSRSYDVATTTIHKTDIQRLGGDGVIIPAESYDAKLINKGRTLEVRLLNLRQNSQRDGDYIGLVTVPSATAPLAVVMVSVQKPGAASSG
jgi:hypothetical protein